MKAPAILHRLIPVIRSLERKNFFVYSLNDNIVRGAAKSLATLPTAWMDNITETTEVLALSLSQYYSRHRGVFQISSSF